MADAAALAVNRLLALDPEVREQVAALEGRRIEVAVEGIATLRFEPGPDRVDVLAVPADRDAPPDAGVDLRMKGSPGALAALLRQRVRGDALDLGGVDLVGDVALAQTLVAIAARFRPEFEEALAGVVGDAPAHALGRALTSAWRHGVAALSALENDVGEYLRHESDVLADPDAAREFSLAVDDLRDDVERLEARIARLAAVRDGGPPG